MRASATTQGGTGPCGTKTPPFSSCHGKRVGSGSHKIPAGDAGAKSFLARCLGKFGGTWWLRVCSAAQVDPAWVGNRPRDRAPAHGRPGPAALCSRLHSTALTATRQRHACGGHCARRQARATCSRPRLRAPPTPRASRAPRVRTRVIVCVGARQRACRRCARVHAPPSASPSPPRARARGGALLRRARTTARERRMRRKRHGARA